MNFDKTRLSEWNARLREHGRTAFRWLRGRLLPVVADLAGRTLRALTATTETANDEDSHFLPSFCSIRTVGGIMLIAQMVAIVITLVTRRISGSLFQDLVIVSAFVQWIALASAAALCAARPLLNRLPNLRALGFAYLILLLVELVVTEGATWVLWLFGAIGTPRPDWYGYFHIQNFSIAVILDALALRYFLARHQVRQHTLAEMRARLEAQRARLRPHFLFNTMNSIASLLRSAPDKAESAIENMADLFRAMLGEQETLVPVNNEITIAKKYLDIESLRFDQRLNVDWDVGKFPRKAVMPVLMLQPLLENAIDHGIEPNPAGGTIRLRLREENDMLHITVSNPLPPKKSAMTAPRGGGTLDTLRLRLVGHYGTAAQLDTKESPDRFTVTVNIPLRGDKA